MKNLLFTFIILLSYIAASAQQLFQDGSGNTTLFPSAKSYGFAYYNTSDKSVSLGFNKSITKGGYDITSIKSDYLLGLDLKIKAKDGIAKVFSGNKLSPGFTLSANLGITSDELGEGNSINLFLRPEIGYNEYKFINTLQPTYTLDKQKKWEPAALLHLSFQFNLNHYTGKPRTIDPTKHSYIFLAFSSGYKDLNNYEDLDDGEISTIRSQSGSTSITTVETGKLGSYAHEGVMPLNVDFGYTPRIFQKNQVGFNTYFRGNLFKENSDSKLGVGLYLADDDKPSSINGGLGWQFNDVFNRTATGKGFTERSTIFFYVGFAIGPK